MPLEGRASRSTVFSPTTALQKFQDVSPARRGLMIAWSRRGLRLRSEGNSFRCPTAGAEPSTTNGRRTTANPPPPPAIVSMCCGVYICFDVGRPSCQWGMCCRSVVSTCTQCTADAALCTQHIADAVPCLRGALCQRPRPWEPPRLWRLRVWLLHFRDPLASGMHVMVKLAARARTCTHCPPSPSQTAKRVGLWVRPRNSTEASALIAGTDYTRYMSEASPCPSP